MSDPVICPYCSKPAVLTDSSAVYAGKSYGPIWFCKPCDAYVGVHHGTHTPLGTLADFETRAARKAAHAAFDPLWRAGKTTRTQAYLWMQRAMGLSRAEAHIARMTAEQCNKLVELIHAGEIVRK